MPFRSPLHRALAALSLTQLLGWGATFWLPAITGPAMAAGLGLPLPAIMAGPTLMLLLMALASWPLRRVFERHGARPVMMLGSALGAAGLLALGLAQGPASYALAWAVLGLAGAGMLTTPAQIALAEIAGEAARTALGLLVLAGGLTSTIIWPLTGLLQAQWGWRGAVLLYAALLLLVCLPLHALVLARRPAPREAGAGDAAPPALDRARFALLALSFAANGFFTWGFALTIIILFEAAGLDHAGAVTAAACIGLAQWAGRMADLLSGGRCTGPGAALAAAALFPLSFLLLMLADGFAGALLFALLYGAASGLNAVIRATLPLQLFPPGAYARAAAGLAVPLNLSFAAAPPAFAALMGRAGPQAALWLAFALSLLALGAMLALLRLQRRPAPGPAARLQA